MIRDIEGTFETGTSAEGTGTDGGHRSRDVDVLKGRAVLEKRAGDGCDGCSILEIHTGYEGTFERTGSDCC